MGVKAITTSAPIYTNAGLATPTIAAGPGVPKTNTINGANNAPAGTPTTGSQFIRTDGTAGARVYWYYSGAWVAATSP